MADIHSGMAQRVDRRTLLMVSPYFPPVLGGLEQYVSRLAGQLQGRHNWRVIVVTSGDFRGEDRCEYVNGLLVYRLGYGIMISRTPLDVHWPRRVREIVRREKPDIVDAHLPVPGLADVSGFVAGDIPLVVTYHMTSMHKGKKRYDSLIWIYERLFGRMLLSRASRIICTSSASQNFLRQYDNKSIIIPPSVDTSVFFPGKAGLGQSLLFVGNLSKAHAHKGLRFLLRALANPLCGDVGLDVVGDGDGRPDYEEQCAQLGIADRVRFRGQLFGQELAQSYRDAFCLVQPSTNDNMPTTIIEAMASGIPVIASRIGSTPVLVRPGVTGYLVAPGDVKSLALAIADLYSDLSRAAIYGEAGLKIVQESYTTEQQADRTAELFDQIIESSAQGRKR